MTTSTKTQSKQINWWKLFVRLQNPMMTWLLNSPLHFFVSKYYMLITFTGRKSGTVYTTPVQYKRTDGRELFIITNRNYVWWKNLQGGADVMVRIKGEDLLACADVSLKPQVIRHAIETMYPSLKLEQKDNFAETSTVILLRL